VSPGPAVRFNVGARTDVGRVREGNEDGYMVHEPLFAVADGMGGHQGGEVASRLALETLEPVAQGGDSEPTSRLAEVVREANRELLHAASQDPQLAGMGTTLTAFITRGDEIHLAHVGDSRAYLLREGELRQLTEDHTVVQRLVDEGRISPEEAEIHPQRSILTRALGVDDDVRVDEAMIEVRPGDRILLCSDGLTGMVPEEDMRRILSEHRDPQEAADALVDAANEAGGQDNITAVVVDVEDSDASAAEDRATSTRRMDRPPPDPDRGNASRAGVRPARRPGPEVWEATERRPRWRIALWLVVPLLLVGGALYGANWWIDQQWFVGVQNDRITLYRGIPARPLGLDLATAVKETAVVASEVQRFPEYAEVDQGITADSEEHGLTIIDEMRGAVRDAEREERQAGTNEPGAG